MELNKEQLGKIEDSLLDSIQKCYEEMAYHKSYEHEYEDEDDDSNPTYWETKQGEYRIVLELIQKELYK